ncbi:MAG: MBL fold metallo-hydrolase [Erysipelotrichaceae bacterium]|nr:MBL fold metallo-hydrolase [Erysipelotrichaceae bacterium]MBR3168255.1 MBL fold metallo-hydrolase [Erysipelotrichaceae bacterium]
MTNVIRINNDTWQIDEDFVRWFLLCGEKEAVLIDTGVIGNARETAERITDLPLKVINTHADRDHIAGNKDFSVFYMHPSDFAQYYHQMPLQNAEALWDGEVFDLGGREIEIIHTPGHTCGSIAVLDRKYRFLFSGDPVQNGDIYMFGPYRNMQAYVKSIERLEKRKDEFDRIFPCHGECPLGPEILQPLKAEAIEVLEGKHSGESLELHGRTIRRVKTAHAGFLLD